MPKRYALATRAGIVLLAVVVWVFGVLPTAYAAERTHSMVKLETTQGDIVIALEDQAAPITTENFLNYVKEGHFDGLIFHRIVPGFVIQGGGFDANMNERPTKDPIQNEADNGLTNDRYTLSMARTSDPHSASCQFFINLTDNQFLNHRAKNAQGWGYAVFGRVVEGQDVVDKIAAVPTKTVGPFEGVPKEPVVITKAVLVE